MCFDILAKIDDIQFHQSQQTTARFDSARRLIGFDNDEQTLTEAAAPHGSSLGATGGAPRQGLRKADLCSALTGLETHQPALGTAVAPFRGGLTAVAPSGGKITMVTDATWCQSYRNGTPGGRLTAVAPSGVRLTAVAPTGGRLKQCIHM